MKKSKLIIICILVIILIIVLAIFIPFAIKGMKINSYQKELANLKMEWSKCEEVQLTNHDKAEIVRAKLNEELGTTVFQSGVLSTPNQTTASKKLSQSIIE